MHSFAACCIVGWVCTTHPTRQTWHCLPCTTCLQFLVTKDGLPALTGSPLLDLTGTKVSSSDVSKVLVSG
jgi:hypothetical protein